MIRYPFMQSVLAVWLGLVSLTVVPSPAAEDPDSPRIAKLIAQLGAGTFREREEASRALEAVGACALEALRRAAQSSDLEVRRRAEELVRKLTQPGELAKLLAPLRIQLKYQDTPVEQAVKDLAKQAGYPISLAGNKAKLAGRRVTLSTGETTFWEAFDQFCRQAGLVEEDPASRQGAPGGLGLRPPGLPGPGGAPAPAPRPAPAPPGLPPPGALPPPPGALPVPPDIDAGKLVLVDGKPPSRPTCYAGAMRIRAVPGSAKASREIQVTLEATPEPRMQWYRPGTPHIDQAVDDHGQALSQAAVPAAGPGMAGLGFGRPNHRQVTVRLQTADKPSRALKVLKGKLTGEVQTPLGELVEVKSILKARGQTVKGKDGTSLEVLEAGRQKDGTIRLEVKLTAPGDIVPAVTEEDLAIPFGHRPPGIGAGQPPRGMVLPNLTGFALVDDKGHPLPLAEAKRAPNATGDAVTHTLVFQPKKGQGEPVKLRFSGARVATISVLFTLKDVPLP
jgi:hypothetical protein